MVSPRYFKGRASYEIKSNRRFRSLSPKRVLIFHAPKATHGVRTQVPPGRTSRFHIDQAKSLRVSACGGGGGVGGDKDGGGGAWRPPRRRMAYSEAHLFYRSR